MSWPASRSVRTAAPGKFSSARKRMSGCAWKNLLGTQHVTGVRQAGKNVFMSNCRVVDQDVRFAPSVSQQSYHELHRQACTPNDRLAGQDVWIEDNGRVLRVHLGRLSY